VRRDLNKEAGISRLLAEVIMAVVVIAIAALVFTYGRGMFGALSRNADFEVTDANYFVNTQPPHVFSVAVKCTGNVKITLQTATVGDQNFDLGGVSLDPGSITGRSWTSQVRIEPGSKVTVRIAGTAEGMGAIEKAVQIVVQG